MHHISLCIVELNTVSYHHINTTCAYDLGALRKLNSKTSKTTNSTNFNVMIFCVKMLMFLQSCIKSAGVMLYECQQSGVLITNYFYLTYN